jgi:hypothetical protein
MSKSDWEEVGRTLLQTELERVSEEAAQDIFFASARRLARGEELRADDIHKMREAVENFRRITELAASATPGVTALPDIWDVLDDESRSKYVQQLQEHPQRSRD